MKRAGLIRQVFIASLAVALAAVLATGLIARRALEAAFAEYLTTLGRHMGPGSGMARRFVVGTAEGAFLTGVDRGIVISVLIAVLLAAVGAWLVARRLVRPIRRLTAASQTLASGDLTHRVQRDGPAEVAELADAFNDMAAALENAEALRRRLVTDVAHELRNPIGALRAQIEGIAEGVIPADQARIASLVEDVATLSRLVDDLQELSIAEAGRLHYEPTRFDICVTVATEAERAAAQVAAEVDIEIACPDGPVSLEADEFRIAQAVRNLLSNAVRHTAHGRIEARVTCEGSEVRVAVTDTGEGIAEADLPLIWERFYRADASRASGTGGTGVGLAITRRIVEDHGGRVFAESRQGEGSTVGFDLPGPCDRACASDRPSASRTA